jgi:tetratricopeptide (TPR) repeat protein
MVAPARLLVGAVIAMVALAPGGAAPAGDPELALRRYRQGLESARAGRSEAAIGLFEEAARLDPDLAPAHFQLANSLAIAGRYGEATAAYDRAIALDPSDARARLGQATALALEKRWLEARERLREGVRALPADLDLLYALARLLVTAPDPEVRDPQRALELARKAYAAAPTLERGETVGMAYAASGDFEEAARWQRDLLARAEATGEQAWSARLRADLERYQRGELHASAP